MPSDRAIRTEPRVRVAVVDSGIHPEHPHVRGVAGGVGIFRGYESDDYLDRIGHGTAVAAAIREKAPEAELLAVKVFDRTLASSVDILVRGIEWAVRHDCRVVNLSLGTSRKEHEAPLQAAVDETNAHGAFLVAASDDGGQQWLPGCLHGVIRVRVDWDCPRDRFRVERRTDGEIVCYASGFPREIPGVPPSRNLMGISFAVANVSGFLARALENHPGASRTNLGEVLSAETAALPEALSS